VSMEGLHVYWTVIAPGPISLASCWVNLTAPLRPAMAQSRAPRRFTTDRTDSRDTTNRLGASALPDVAEIHDANVDGEQRYISSKVALLKKVRNGRAPALFTRIRAGRMSQAYFTGL